MIIVDRFGIFCYDVFFACILFVFVCLLLLRRVLKKKGV